MWKVRGREICEGKRLIATAVTEEKALELARLHNARPECRFLECKNKVLNHGDACRACFESHPETKNVITKEDV